MLRGQSVALEEGCAVRQKGERGEGGGGCQDKLLKSKVCDSRIESLFVDFFYLSI